MPWSSRPTKAAAHRWPARPPPCGAARRRRFWCLQQRLCRLTCSKPWRGREPFRAAEPSRVALGPSLAQPYTVPGPMCPFAAHIRRKGRAGELSGAGGMAAVWRLLGATTTRTQTLGMDAHGNGQWGMGAVCCLPTKKRAVRLGTLLKLLGSGNPAAESRARKVTRSKIQNCETGEGRGARRGEGWSLLLFWGMGREFVRRGWETHPRSYRMG